MEEIEKLRERVAQLESEAEYWRKEQAYQKVLKKLRSGDVNENDRVSFDTFQRLRDEL